MTDVAGRTAIVTGGASGIGRALAEQLHAAGARVFVLDFDAAAAEATATAIGCGWRRCDVADAAGTTAAVRSVEQEAGRVEVTVLNAGVGSFGPLSDMSTSDWSWMLGVNTWGVVHGVQAVLPGFLAEGSSGGHVVVVASMSALAPALDLGVYAAGKAAVVALGEVLAAELTARGMPGSVTIAFPGPTRTNISDSQRTRTDRGGLVDRRLEDAGFDWIRWQEPAQTAGTILAAVRAGDLYAITHPELRPRFDQRTAALAAAFDVAEARLGDRPAD